MKTRNVISSKGALQFVAMTELYTSEFYPGVLDGQHYAILRVYRYRSEIYRTGTFPFGVLSLRNVLYHISLRFTEKPRELQFVLFVFSSIGGHAVVTSLPLNSQLTFQHGSKNGHPGMLVVGIRNQKSISLIETSINESVSRFTKKDKPRAVKGLSRVRTPRVSPEVHQVTVTQTSTSLGIPDIVNQSSRVDRFRSFTSVRTPGFKSLSKAGNLPVNPYEMYLVEVNNGFFNQSYSYVHKPTGGQSRFTTRQDYSDHLTRENLPGDHLSVDENLVVSRLANRISDGNANLAEDAATANQSLRLFTKSVDRLKGLAVLLRTGNLNGYFRSLGLPGSKNFYKSYSAARRGGLAGSVLLSELWLEYRYGWLPLLNDISASMKAYSQYIARNPRVLSVSASLKHKSQSEFVIANLAQIHSGSRIGRRLITTDTKCRIGLHYHCNNALLAMFSQLGLSSPTALAWELTPYSFVVDWFLPVGQALAAASAFDGLTFHSGYKTYFTKQVGNLSLDFADSASDVTYDYQESISGACSGHSVHMSRVKLNAFPSSRVPHVKNPFSYIHAANAVALLVTNLTRR